MKKGYLAHSPTPLHPEGQPLEAHLDRVAERAAGAFDDNALARLAAVVGAYHDRGKAKAEFMTYLKTGQGHVDHSTAGGIQLAEQLAKPWLPLVVPPVLGHHGGLPNGFSTSEDGTRSAEQRLREKLPDEVAAAFADEPVPAGLLPPQCRSIKTAPMELYLYCKLLYSALVDADYLDTEEYFQPEQAALRGRRPGLLSLVPRYDAYMQQCEAESRPSRINALRREIRWHCLDAAAETPGFYSLTVPTGGGKTLASLGFALHHAQAHPELRRIIYAIPFCSIIEQNADVFRKVLGQDAVLEHHSAVQPPENGTKSDLAAENWDSPVVVTTNVQLFESLFSNKPSRCRKLHNIQNSILILDEMQALPDELLKPCLEMLDALVKDAHVTVVICTATQPAYGSLWKEPPAIREIIPQPDRLFEQMKRTYAVPLGMLEETELVERLAAHEQVLCIVNRRASAQSIARALGGEAAGVYHLSTLMCPAHRTEKLAVIRQRLAAGQPCKIISTSLIEAGVDIDLPVVYREAAGLDSVAQASGRCNRNGALETLAPVYIFQLPGGGGPAQIKRQGELTLKEIAPLYDDLLSQEALAHYFRLRFGAGAVLDKPKILQMIYERKRDLWFPFADIAKEFNLIQSAGEPLFVPYNAEAAALLQALPYAETTRSLLRRLQPYGVTIYSNQQAELAGRGLLREKDGIYWLDVADCQKASVYTEGFGLCIEAEPAFLCF